MIDLEKSVTDDVLDAEETGNENQVEEIARFKPLVRVGGGECGSADPVEVYTVDLVATI